MSWIDRIDEEAEAERALNYIDGILQAFRDGGNSKRFALMVLAGSFLQLAEQMGLKDVHILGLNDELD